MNNIREKLKRRFSHKDPDMNLDDADSADEETTGYLSKEIEDAEKKDEPLGRPGSLLNRMLSHGNSKTEKELEEARRLRAAAGTDTTSTAATTGQQHTVTTGQ